MAEDNKPYYKSSRAEEFLNYLVGSADDYPHDAPASRMEEYLQYLCAHQGEGGGGVEPLIVYTEGTMQTSTLPAIVVPKLTKDQLDDIHTAVSQGKLVVISDGNGHYIVTEIDETYDGVRFVYANAYLDYYLEGSNVVCAHTLLEGGGETPHLYVHEVKIDATNQGNPTRDIEIRTKIITSTPDILSGYELGKFLYKNNYRTKTSSVIASGSIYVKSTVTQPQLSIINGIYTDRSNGSQLWFSTVSINFTSLSDLTITNIYNNTANYWDVNPSNIIDTVEQIF